jgi:two-component system, NarL family, nitrate/nitrite response regulator NarL
VTDQLTVLVVDDHPVVHRGMSALLAGVDWVGRTVIAQSVAEALAQGTTHRPDLAVVDLRLPDGNGVEVVRQLGRIVPGCRALVLTMDAEPGTVRRAMEAGAAGYLLKDCEPELILDALSTLRHGGLVLGARALTALSKPDDASLPAPFDRLTPREVTLAALVGAGLGNHAVATRLGVSEKTVRNQLSTVLVRVGARDRVHLAVLVRELGISPPKGPTEPG